MGIKIAIDASRGRSGGAKAHLIGVLNEVVPTEHDIDEIHVWAYRALLDKLPNYKWLIKHAHPDLEKSLLHQLWWQLKKFPKEIIANGCDVLLSTDAGTVLIHNPSVVMSRDMLSYERREIARYGLSLGRLRLFILRFVQNRSLKKASGALFLTEYAANTICTWTGPIAKFKVIPHGVGSDFKNAQQKLTWPNGNERPIRCLYVSNTAMYKHQWNVVRAIKELRDEGYNVNITLAGGGRGPAQRKLEETIKEIDPDSIFSKQKKFIPYDKLPELLTNADIFIFASSCENMPNTLVEAMAVGLPIASSILGPMPEVLKDGGTYFDPENSSSIANAVKELIGNDLHRINLAMRAKQLSKQYSWKRCASETMSFLVEVFLDYQRKSNV